MTSPDEEPLAQSLGDIARHNARHNGISAVFRAGLTGGEHRWELRSAAGDLLAVTARVHNGGRGARAFWKLLTLTGMDAGNDIHLELHGAQGRVLARISSANDAPATVTVLDDAGALVAKSHRDKTLLLKVKHPDTFVVMDADEKIVARVDCEADQPWQVVDGAGALVGELVAGKPGPTLSPTWSDWIDPKWALSVATYANAQHLGIAGAQQYTTVTHAEPPEGQSVATALLPLIAGLSY